MTDTDKYHLPKGTSADDGPYDLLITPKSAGPGPDRAWLICDNPAHGSVRTTWDSRATDPRLPFGAKETE